MCIQYWLKPAYASVQSCSVLWLFLMVKISHMRGANDLAKLHICAVSPEPSLIALKRRDVNEGSGPIFYHLMWFRYLSHMRAAKDQASLHIHTVSPETSLIALERRDIDEGSGIFVYTVMWFVLFAYSSIVWSGVPAPSHSIITAFAAWTEKGSNVDEGSGPTLVLLRQWFCCCWFILQCPPLVCRGSVFLVLVLL